MLAETSDAVSIDHLAHLRAVLATVASDLDLCVPDAGTRLSDLGLDSLSLVAFLVAVQERFELSQRQLAAVLDGGRTFGDLLALCQRVSSGN